MSDTDSFIEEVTEEVRRERLFGYLKRYGWIGVAAVVLIVGGTAWNERAKSQAALAAQDLGDAILLAYDSNDPAERAETLETIQTANPTARAALDMITAAELTDSDQIDAAADRLTALAANNDVPEIYRQLAAFKALLVQSETLDAGARISGFEQIAVPGHPMRLLAQEQLALISAETGETDRAIDQLQVILSDAEATQGLQQRALQVIVALGGEPDLSALQNATPHNQN